MRKKFGFAAAAIAAAAMLFCAVPAYAADSVDVTYRVPFFREVVQKTNAGAIPAEVFMTDVRGDIYGMPDHKLAAENLQLTWYRDAAYTQPYEFDTGLDSDTTLYGKLTEAERYFSYNGFGWDTQSGTVYAGDPVYNRYITNSQYDCPTYTDESDGTASLSLSGAEYVVYGRGLDVSKPFTVTLDFTNVIPDLNTAWFILSLFSTVTTAQVATTAPWANAGAAGVLMFNMGNGGAPQGFVEGMNLLGYVSSTTTEYANGGADFTSLFADGNLRISLTVSVTDSGTSFSSGDTVVATSPATRADFASGYAYLSFGSTGSASQRLGVDVTVEQSAGTVTASADGHAQLGELSVNGMAVTLPIDLAEGYEIASVTANGEAVPYSLLYGETNVYVLDLPFWGADASVSVTTQKIGGETSGCNSALGAESAVFAALAFFSCAAFRRRRTI